MTAHDLLVSFSVGRVSSIPTESYARLGCCIILFSFLIFFLAFQAVAVIVVERAPPTRSFDATYRGCAGVK